MRYLLLLIFFLSGLCSAQEIRVDLDIIEMAEKEIKDYGVEKSVLLSGVTQRLAQSGITVKSSPNLPQLLIRIKSLPTDTGIATFVQTCFFEEAMLPRKKENVWAITWLQSGMIIGPKESYTQNVTQEVMNNVGSFILEYPKILSSNTP